MVLHSVELMTHPFSFIISLKCKGVILLKIIRLVLLIYLTSHYVYRLFRVRTSITGYLETTQSFGERIHCYLFSCGFMWAV